MHIYIYIDLTSIKFNYDGEKVSDRKNVNISGHKTLKEHYE